MTPLASSDFGRMLSVGAIRFEDRFCASRKGRTGGGGCVYRSAWQRMVAVAAACRKALVNDGWVIYCSAWQRMVAVAAACRKALVNDGWAICLLSCTNACRRALTIERLLMSGCVQGREPTENGLIKP